MTQKELHDARSRAGWTQARLASALGVTVTTVSRWETGQRAIDKRTEIAIRAVFGVFTAGRECN